MIAFPSIQPVVLPDRRPTPEFVRWTEGLSSLSDASGTSGSVTPESYGAVGDGVADDTTPIEEALAETRVVLNGTYRITRAISVTVAGLKHVSGTGTIYQDANVSAVTLIAPYPTAVAVSTINAVNHTFPGTGTASLQATEIVAAGHGLEIGDIFKIVADDQIPGAATGKRIGEFGYVADVSGDNVYMGGRLQETYATNIRLVKVPQEPVLIWDGPGFDSNSAVGYSEDWSGDYLTVRGFVRPRVRTTVRNGYSIGVNLHSCFQALADVEVHRMRNRVSSQSVPGYGVQDTCSFQSQVTVRGTDCRHFYTDITNTTTTNDAPHKYGRTRGSVISGQATGSSAAAWDTHSEGANITFLGCTSANSYPGEDASATGIQLRGQRNRMIGGTDFASVNGAQFYAQFSGDCQDCQLIDWSYNGARDAVRLSGNFQVKRALVRGGILRTTNNRAVYALNCDATFTDVTIAMVGSTAGTTAFVLGENARLRIRRLVVDISGFTGTSFRVFAFDASTSVAPTLIVESAQVIGGAFQAWFNGANNPGTATLAELSSDSAPTSGTSINAGSATVTVTNTAATLADHEARIAALEP